MPPAPSHDHGSPQRAEAVWDVVVLHGTGGIAAYKSVETLMGADGIDAT